MPYLTIQSNIAIDPASRDDLLQQASTLVSSLLGKPEQYVMVALHEPIAMSFAGSNEPVAYLEFKSIGLPENESQKFSAALCTLINDLMGVDQSRIYIEFANASRHLWGWKGSTF